MPSSKAKEKISYILLGLILLILLSSLLTLKARVADAASIESMDSVQASDVGGKIHLFTEFHIGTLMRGNYVGV